jgi:predicted transglutaminase-like cysteine proteinase
VAEKNDITNIYEVNNMNQYCKKFFLTVVVGLLITSAYLLSGISPAFGKNEFVPWEDGVFTAVEKKHGAAAAERIRKVHDFIIANQFKPVAEQLELVNDYMNALPWIADPDIWKRPDYWATPFETIATFGGDCEDIAIAKYVVLRMMGIPDDKLGFAYVQTSNKERHMVMIYKEAKGIPGMILDNQHPDVVPAPKRRDLLAIYAFKNDGSFYLIADDGKSDRKVKAKVDHKKLAMWASAKERSRKNTAYYEQFNAGRPLIPDWIRAQSGDREFREGR